MTDQIWDAPNQQVVRPDESAPWEEGTGAGADVDGEPGPVEPEANSLDDMTKDELIEEASRRGIDVNSAMTKAEIRAAIDAG